MRLEVLSAHMKLFWLKTHQVQSYFFPVGPPQDRTWHCSHPEPQDPSTPTPTAPESMGKQLEHNHTNGFKIFLDLFLIRKEASNPFFLITRNILG